MKLLYNNAMSRMSLRSGYDWLCAGQGSEESQKCQNPALQNGCNWRKAAFPTGISNGSTRLYLLLYSGLLPIFLCFTVYFTLTKNTCPLK